MNILYDRDHYKLALGQIASAKHLIDNVGKEYLKLLKYGDSLYRCKALKRAALGRMATIMKRQKESLAYLEQVRQHMARLPSIDASGRTLLLCGYPNVGKSSFMNCVTRAEVDVQPYAFTTKSLFVGHMDYKYLRWQVIDTPGLLDHPLEERNTIEMQSITALAHIRACVLYFVDLSGQCGYTLGQQLALFKSLKALFIGKPVMLVTTKSDIMTIADLNFDDAELLNTFIKENELSAPMSLSALQEDGVMAVRNVACDTLLETRVAHKLNSTKGETVTSVLDRLHMAVPKARDAIVRAPHIPAAVFERKVQVQEDTEMEDVTSSLRHDNDFNLGLQDRKKYILKNMDWMHDIIPEIISGKNISDFIDPDIESKLALLEEEELEWEARYKPIDRNPELEALKNEVNQARGLATLKSRLSNRGGISKVETMKKKRTALLKRTRIAGPEYASDEEGGDDRADSRSLRNRLSERSRSRVADRLMKGFPSSSTALITSVTPSELSSKSSQLMLLAQKKRNLHGNAGEADRHHVDTLPKHLFSGKRKNGTHDRR